MSLHISTTPFAHLFVLIICEIITHIRCIQTSYFTPNTLCRAHNLMSLHTSKDQNHNVSTSKTSHFDTYPNPNSPCAHLFILIIFHPISHIYAVHTQRKVYHSMPLHTYTVNFATSSNLQEIL